MRASSALAALATALLLGSTPLRGETPGALPMGPFKAWETALETGILLPQGDLADVLAPAPLAGARLSTSYYGRWRAVGALSYTRLDGPDSPASVDYVAAAAGLAWRAPRPWIPGVESALVLHYVRAAEVDPSHQGYLFLEDGESEFGTRAGLLWEAPFGASLRCMAGARWDLLFTGPEYSHLATLLLGVAWIY